MERYKLLRPVTTTYPVQFRDLRRQYARLQDSIDRAVSEVIASGSYIMGPAVTQLEQDLATYTGVRHVVTCANGNNNYIADELAFTYDSYEACNRVFVRGTAERLADTMAEMLTDLN